MTAITVTLGDSRGSLSPWRVSQPCVGCDERLLSLSGCTTLGELNKEFRNLWVHKENGLECSPTSRMGFYDQKKIGFLPVIWAPGWISYICIFREYFHTTDIKPNTSKHLLPGLHSFKIKQNEINPNLKAHLLHEKQYPERPIFITSWCFDKTKIISKF